MDFRVWGLTNYQNRRGGTELHDATWALWEKFRTDRAGSDAPKRGRDGFQHDKKFLVIANSNQYGSGQGRFDIVHMEFCLVQIFHEMHKAIPMLLRD
ncbi:hypothetical protein [Luteimonas sp. R10]|uniref:hypothetical protein n=1 Tax=Luteimonas sp. R10 TaxID=3108176 RepID=UPI00308E1671|nr:hypothetical protein U3649_14775 [Luteimonas sp. R10]